MGAGYNISRGRAFLILAIWIIITISIALMVAYIPDHSCPDDGGEVTTGSPEVTDTPTPTLPPQGDGPWMIPFLDQLIRPVHYELYMDPDFYYNGTTYKGRENITIEMGVETEHIIVHYKYMNIINTRVWDEDWNELEIAETFSYEPHEYYVTSLVNSVPPGSLITLHLEFEGSLDNGIVGYYKSTYTNSITGETSWMSTTKFQPTDARKAFPNFDEPAFKSNFTITQRHWCNFTALSNMPEIGRVELDATWCETSFDTTVLMSSYLVCFIVFDFEYRNNTIGLNNQIEHRMWAPPDRIDQVEYALALTKDLMDYFEAEFQMPYHLPKLDQVAVPDYPSGATEHWGLITYRESRLLYDEMTAAASDRQNVAEIVAHELAHNWFGNAITCLWWNDIWLNEGFAVYYDAAESLNEIEPDFESADHFVTGVLQPMMVSDAEASSRAITEDVTHPDEINQAFSSAVYSKGASILRMIDNFMAGENFRDALRIFLKEHEYGSVTTAQLWDALQGVMGSSYDIATMMEPWVAQMGLPVINVSTSGVDIVLKQFRFLNDPDADPSLPESEYNYKWYVPVSYFTKNTAPGPDEEPPIIWMNMTDLTFTDPRNGDGDWLKLNYKEFGYYRVNYEREMWNDLSQQLNIDFEVLTTVDRANIIDDAFNLARASQLSYPVALDLTQYLFMEKEYFPWSAVGNGLSYISSMLYSDSGFTQWRGYIQNISTPMMNLLGVEDNDEDEHLDKLNREYIIMPLSCGHGYEECLANTTALFLAWIEDQDYDLSPNLRRNVYRYGMQQTGEDEIWETVWQRYELASGAEKDNLAYCLAQTDRMWLIKRYLEYAMDETKIRQQDFFTVINYIAYNRKANRHLWDWTRANYDALVERFGVSDRYFGRMVPNIVARYNNEFHLMEVEEFYARYPEAGAGAGPRDASLASIEANIAWMTRNRDAIIAWLNENYGDL